MAQFPIRETEILGLGDSLITGLENNVPIYPSPPVSTIDLQAAFDATIAARDAAVAAQAAAEQATTEKQLALEDLIEKMKDDLRYAETTVNFDDDKLKLLGWGGRKAPSALDAPGQARALEAPREGEGWIFLDWKSPTEGGKVASYKIERRERPEGAWSIAGMAMESESTLHNQERGKEWEYRVIAVNKTGEGMPSNTVMAVL